jgi:hypothetical protein
MPRPRARATGVLAETTFRAMIPARNTARVERLQYG